jgi:hypothetical protein
MADLQFRVTAAAGYDRGVGEMTRRIVPVLVRAAIGQRVPAKEANSVRSLGAPSQENSAALLGW